MRRVFFHGTTIEAGKSILESKLMQPSMGDEQWLGDGCYFFKDDLYAFRWILIKYTKNFKSNNLENIDDIYEKYMILSADISLDKVFSLDNLANKMLFLKVKSLLEQKLQDSPRYRKCEIVDGVVINVMFNEMGYADKYDAVEATYPIAYVYDTNSRQDYIPEYQLCVKNLLTISNVQKYNGTEVSEEYMNFIKEYNTYKQNYLRMRRKKPRYKRRQYKYTYNK